MGKLFAGLFGVVAVFAIVILISLLLIKIGWGMFMVPVFGMAELTWGQAFGFSLLASCFRGSSFNKSKD